MYVNDHIIAVVQSDVRLEHKVMGLRTHWFSLSLLNTAKKKGIFLLCDLGHAGHVISGYLLWHNSAHRQLQLQQWRPQTIVLRGRETEGLVYKEQRDIQT